MWEPCNYDFKHIWLALKHDIMVSNYAMILKLLNCVNEDGFYYYCLLLFYDMYMQFIVIINIQQCCFALDLTMISSHKP